MRTITRLGKMWDRNRKYASRYILVFTGSVLIHAILAVLFATEGRTEFAVLNGFSIVFYLVWMAVFARKPINGAMLFFLYADVILHACTYNLTLGPGPGFFIYPFIIIPVTFFLSACDLKHPSVMFVSGGLSILSVVLMLLTLRQEPLHPLAEQQSVDMLFQVNLLLCALLLSIYTSEFMSETLSTQDNLSFYAENDQLTGVRNRYGFSKEMEGIHGTQYCVVMCDIDDFKQVNDLYSHSTGDAILRKIAAVLSGAVSKEDIICRWGGEEFLLVIRSSLRDACALTEQIRKKVSEVAVEWKDTTVRVTMTFGLADCLEATSFDDLVKIADRNLLRGKRFGKNCVMLSSTNPETDGIVQEPESALDTSFLTERMFSAFAATSDTTYIYMCNLNTNVSRWSRTAVDYFGLPGEFMYDAGNIWMGFIHPDDRKAYAEDIDAVLSGRKRFHDVAYRARNQDGEYVRLSCKGVVTEGDATHPAVFAGTMTNLGLAEADAGSRR